MLRISKVVQGWSGQADLFCPYSSVVEHFLGKEEVSGSSPDMGSNLLSPECINI